jgi:subtilisin family serine protease/plastocyanin
MSEREYIVSLNKGVDYKAFNQEMVATTGAGAIPGRSVDVANARPGSLRNTHYMLTEDEAAALNNDARVLACELRPDLRDDIEIGRLAVQTGDFTKTTSDSGDFVNWGLARCNYIDNPYIGNNVSGGYNHTLDGTGVDIVIQDSGIQVDHPDFNNYSGTSRVQQIDWYAASGLPGTQNANHYRDYDGHGTHCAGIAAGLTYGWAKNANIYAVKVSGLEGASDAGTGIPISDCFDVIKEWHNNKPIDLATGAKRPTIVNMSWGYGAYFTRITGGSYRGTPWSGDTRRTDYGMVGVFDGSGYRFGVRVASVDVDLEELIDAGVHVCIAAGNSFQKIDISGGLDYDNYFTDSFFGNRYYNRGGSPHSQNAFMVGNIDSSIHSGGKEQKATSSESGPGVTLYAPGTNIMSTTSNVNKFTSGAYPANSSYKICNISGTSMASPQVAGIAALYAQIQPDATPAELITFITANAGSSKLYTTGLDNDYGDSRSLKGGNNLFAFNKFNTATQMLIGDVDKEGALAPSYTLQASTISVNEGGSFTVTLTTTNVADGVQVPYTITGVTSDDIGGESLTGNFNVLLGTATLNIDVTVDQLTEGPETFTISLDNVAESASVSINDTSVSVTPTYTLTASVPNVSEGDDVIITLTTEYVEDGTNVAYLISGVTSADISGQSLSGNLTVQSNTSSIVIRVSEDATTEGLETLVFSLVNGEDSVSVQIADTSTAGSPAYNLLTSAEEINEGQNFTITLNTLNIPDTTIIPYTITGVDSTDINGAPTSGSFTIISNTASLVITTTADVTTEGDETFTLSLNNGADSISVTIKDTSLTPEAGFVLSADSTNINEGGSVTITLNTTNIQNGDPVAYTITGINADDLSVGDITGNFTIVNNTDELTFTLAEDLATEGTETMTLTLDGPGTSIDITVNDTSLAPTYTLTPSVVQVNEGDTLTVTLTTTGRSEGDSINYSVTGIDEDDLDVGTTSGVFTLDSNGSSTAVFQFSEDSLTEGDEFFTLSLTGGPVASTTVTVKDTSLTPAFVPDYQITVTNAGNNYYMSGQDRNGTFSNQFQPTLAYNNGDKVQFNVDASTASAHPFYIKTQQVAGTGSQAIGVVGQGTGTLQWTIGATGTYYYQCSIHDGMNNSITVS